MLDGTHADTRPMQRLGTTQLKQANEAVHGRTWSQMAPKKSAFCDPPPKAHFRPCNNEGVFEQDLMQKNLQTK